MRASVPDYDLRTARSLEEALTLRADGYQPIAGGTDIMVLFQANQLRTRRFVDLTKLI